MIERISLNSIKFFYFIAKYGSVTIAAEKLFVTQSAVSKQLLNIESLLETPLFLRVNKSLVLTKEGEKLYDCCSRFFSELDECLIDIKKKKVEEQYLVVSCEPTLAMKWLIPRLSRFKEHVADFEVVLLTAGGAINFDSGRIDLAIRRNDFEWSNDIYSEKLADEYVMHVQNAKKENVSNLLISKSRPNFLNLLRKNSLMSQTLKKSNTIEFEHFYLCLEACLAGLGSTIVSKYMIEKELDLNLLEPISEPIHDGSSYYLLSNTSYDVDPRKKIFLHWLKKEMSV